MPSLILVQGTHRVIVMADVKEDTFKVTCPVTDFLYENSHGSYSGSVRGFKTLFARFAEGGRKKLTAELFHRVDDREDIWEFIKGDLRIFAFCHGNDVILTHGCIKKSGKVDPKEVAAAVRARESYSKK